MGEQVYQLIQRMYRAAGFQGQQQFATKIGVTQGYVSNLLKPLNKGGREPSEEIANKIADVCARSEHERMQYRQMLNQARIVRFLPGGLPDPVIVELPRLGMDAQFLKMLDKDLQQLPLDQRRQVVRKARLSYRHLLKVLRGEALLDHWQVMRLAQGLRRNPMVYLLASRLISKELSELAATNPEFVDQMFRLSPRPVNDLLSKLSSLSDTTTLHADRLE